MLTKAFNCLHCEKPFDCKEGEPRMPMFSQLLKLVWCRACGPNTANVPQRSLMEFLNQPAFKKTADGYEYNAPFNDPICFGCLQNIQVLEGCSAFPVNCGHFLCHACHFQRMDGVGSFCNKCKFTADRSKFYAADSRLAAFSHDVKEAALKAKLDEQAKVNKALKLEKAQFEAYILKKEAARKDEGLKECGDCGKQHHVESLLQCQDHKAIVCGACFFESHQGHSVVKLLGIELDQLEKQNDKRYTETVEGLHGNLQYLQKNIDNAVDKVLLAGKNRLATITKCGKYDEAQKVVSRVEDAANKFEKHCEVYIPVARELATRLEELSEELVIASMLTKAFNCPDCAAPFDCNEGEPRAPFYSILTRMVFCHSCATNVKNVPQRGLMEFLNQPAFKKTDDGYEYTAPFNDPVCFGCEQKIKLMEGCNAFPVHCGHFLCKACNRKRIDDIYSSCNKCNMTADRLNFYPADIRLVVFSSEIEKAELKAQLDVRDNEAATAETRKECGNCGKQCHVDSLLRCDDHQTIICGVCFFESHQGHYVSKLLSIELGQLERQNAKRYTETVEGLHGNLQYVQINIDNVVYKVLIAGKNRLATITKCGKYDEAQKVVSRVEDAANKFEKHCEVYIPVARELATRLEELSEELGYET